MTSKTSRGTCPDGRAIGSQPANSRAAWRAAGYCGDTGMLGRVAETGGDWDRALSYYRREGDAYESLGDRAGQAGVLHDVGLVLRKKGDSETAVATLGLSLKIRQELGSSRQAAQQPPLWRRSFNIRATGRKP